MRARRCPIIERLLASTILLLIIIGAAYADDTQLAVVDGDTQTCIGSEQQCMGMTTDTPDGTIILNSSISVAEVAYTINDIVNLTHTSINNTGTGISKGRLLLTVEFNTSGTWNSVATIINDTNTATNRTIAPNSSLDVAQLWNAVGWNTTLAGSGNYRVRMKYYDLQGVLQINTTSGFLIVDQLTNLLILAPSNNSAASSKTVNVTFNISGYRNATQCNLLIDDQQFNSSSAITGGQNNITANGVNAGKHNITISCSDAESHVSTSPITRITLIPASTFSGQTTDLSSVNLSNITNLTLDKPSIGKIKFLESVDLSEGGDIDTNVVISHNLISIDSTNLAALNKSATLTMENISEFEHPIILRDGQVCAECSITSFSSGTLTFDVQHFSSYTSAANSQLTIFDTTDTTAVGPLATDIFYANYTNRTSGAAISTGACNITFNDTNTSSMTYDSGTQEYVYNRTFSPAGVYYYSISCSATDFETLSTTDYASISSGDGPTGAILNATETSRANITLAPQGTLAQGGNTTEVNINALAITNTWQGVYGNVSGEVVLATANNTKFYNWSILGLSGEVYASRAGDVNFATVGCSDSNHITTEDQFLGTATDDSVNKTFNQTNHPGFMTGSVNHVPNSCRSTNIYGAGGQNLSKYYEVVLTDGANNTIYTSLLQSNTAGYNGRINDFEIMVPTKKNVIQPYYYWIEIN